MADIESTPSYILPKWRIAATFAATDGRTPETIEVECNEAGVDGALFAASVIPVLADVAARRHSFVVQDRGPAPAAALAVRELPDDANPMTRHLWQAGRVR